MDDIISNYEPPFNIKVLEEFISLIKLNEYDEEKLLEYYNSQLASKVKTVDGKEITFQKLSNEDNKRWIKLCKSGINLDPKKVYSLDLTKVLYDIKEKNLSSFHGDRYFPHLDVKSNARIIESLIIAVNKMNGKGEKKLKKKIKNIELTSIIEKGVRYFSKLSKKQQKKILALLTDIKDVQDSNKSLADKTTEIKKTMWTNQSAKSKLFIGGFLGTVFGFLVFGTGGIGIAAFGGAVGIWGFLAGTAGGVLVSSLIQNFEKNDNGKE